MMDFQELYDSYSQDVYRFALWIAGDRTKAEDLTSETFIRPGREGKRSGRRP